MDLKITWMDGISETFGNVTATVLNGVLHVHEYTGVTRVLKNEWHFPTANIRVWAPAGQGNGHAYAQEDPEQGYH